MESKGVLFEQGYQTALAGFFATLVILILGVSLADKNHDPYPWNILSSILGWSYFFAWSISFYPQLILNWQRGSARGLATDFLWYNLIGFSCYSIYSFCFYAIPSVREAYRDKNDGKDNLVTLNDVIFAVHAFFITLLTLAQVYLLEYEKEAVSRFCKIFGGIAVLSAVGVALFSDILTTLYFVSYIKLLISVIKYCPQVYMNCIRRSTVGWSMGNVLLDFSGGTLSLLQLILDGATTKNWAGVIGNPVKFGLGFISMGFDVIFMVQHFILFKSERFIDDDESESEEFMLRRSNESDP